MLYSACNQHSPVFYVTDAEVGQRRPGCERPEQSLLAESTLLSLYLPAYTIAHKLVPKCTTSSASRLPCNMNVPNEPPAAALRGFGVMQKWLDHLSAASLVPLHA